mmetsp:Transcript_18828/g.49377  ORF Transcript_18828/g.49377 Transcript_18828/m.49377 type:complete len:104 (+) Transcript_18828:1269-1580(+)
MDRPRVLSRKMAEMMASNSLNGAPADWLGPGAGFGLGFNICMDPGAAGRVGSPGTLMWAGIFGTEYFIDPVEHICAVLLTQRFPNDDIDLRKKFPQLVMQAAI